MGKSVKGLNGDKERAGGKSNVKGRKERIRGRKD